MSDSERGTSEEKKVAPAKDPTNVAFSTSDKNVSPDPLIGIPLNYSIKYRLEQRLALPTFPLFLPSVCSLLLCWQIV